MTFFKFISKPCKHTGFCENFDYSNWPFDSHSCNFTFGSWMKSGEEMNFKTKVVVNSNRTQLSNEWKLTNTSIYYEKGIYDGHDETFPTIEVQFKLERHNDFPSVAMTVPSFILMLTNLLAFYFDAKSSPRLVLILISIISHEIFLECFYWM